MSETPGQQGPSIAGVAPEGHAEGEWVPDPSGRHQFRYFVHGQETDWVSDSGVEILDDHAEWRPDPTGRHQFRYFVRGEPTAAVSDNGIQSTEAAVPPPGPTPPVGRTGLPVWPFLVGGAVVLLLLVVLGVVVLGGDDESSTTTTVPATTALTFAPGPVTTPPTTTAPPTAPTTVTPGGGQLGTTSVFDLQVGDCITSPTGSTVTGVACSVPHDFEVYALFDVPGAPGAAYPGDSAISDLANTGCQGDRFTNYIGQPYSTSSIYATSLNPSESTWTAQDDREVVCMARAQAGQLTGSVRNSNQ